MFLQITTYHGLSLNLSLLYDTQYYSHLIIDKTAEEGEINNRLSWLMMLFLPKQLSIAHRQTCCVGQKDTLDFKNTNLHS